MSNPTSYGVSKFCPVCGSPSAISAQVCTQCQHQFTSPTPPGLIHQVPVPPAQAVPHVGAPAASPVSGSRFKAWHVIALFAVAFAIGWFRVAVPKLEERRILGPWVEDKKFGMLTFNEDGSCLISYGKVTRTTRYKFDGKVLTLFELARTKGVGSSEQDFFVSFDGKTMALQGSQGLEVYRRPDAAPTRPEQPTMSLARNIAKPSVPYNTLVAELGEPVDDYAGTEEQEGYRIAGFKLKDGWVYVSHDYENIREVWLYDLQRRQIE